MTTKEILSKRIRTLRTERNLSQQQLADLMFVSRVTVTNWENGNRVPDINLLLRLSKILDVEIYDLVDDKENEEEAPVMIIVEDEPVILKGFVHLLSDTLPDTQVFGFQSGTEALQFAQTNRVSAAFLDIELRETTGLELCRALLDINPRTNVVYLTAYSNYALDAWSTGASGFMLKPITPEGVREQLEKLRYPFFPGGDNV